MIANRQQASRRNHMPPRLVSYCGQPAVEAVTSKNCTSRVHYAILYARCTYAAVGRDQSKEFVSVVIGVPGMMHDNSGRRSEFPVAIRYCQGHWSSKVDTHDAANVSPLFGSKSRRRIQTPDSGGKDQANSYQHSRSVVNLERVSKKENKSIVGARMDSKEQEKIMARRSDTQGN
jgi:hypothetical protein